MTGKMPVMSKEGGLSDARSKFERALAHYATTQRNQTTYFDSIISLPYTVNQHQSDPQALCNAIQNEFYIKLSKLFTSVSLSVSYADDATDASKYAIIIVATVADEMGSFSTTRVGSVSYTGLNNFVKFNNQS